MPLNYGDPISPYGQDPTAPLAMRMMEHMPGITASIGFSTRRGANTLIRGGYLDDVSGIRGARRAAKYGSFAPDALEPTSIGRSSFAFGRRRFSSDAAAAASGKNMFIKASALNNTPRIKNINRFHSLSVFTAKEGKGGLYTFAQGHRLLNKLSFSGLREAAGIADDVAMFGPGTLSAITAGTRLDRLGSRANLAQLELNVKRLATANNPALLRANPATLSAAAFGGAAPAPSTSFIDDSMKILRAGGPEARGVSGNLMASAMAGPGTQYLAGYFRGAQGFASAAGLEGKALMGAQKAVSNMVTALGTEGIKGVSTKFVGEAGAKALLEGSVLKQLGTKGTFKALTTGAGAKVLGARAAALAIPGLQVVAAASLVYDLSKMGGEIIKSGINLARDANKSLQGSINKPMFGMGYQDTELAATSRARGVMAIQNSRLNARSVLGSEAAMMAAHFG